MKNLLLVFFILTYINCNATIYYFSESGNDNNAGTSESSPFKTLKKLNSLSLVAGDFVLFKKGEIFQGSIIIKDNGSAGNPITFSSYGSGANPVITGFTTVDLWRQKSKNIWESTNAVSSLNYTNMVVINGVNTPMGRYPNSGYFLYNNPTTNPYSISSTDLSNNINWTGAELVANNTTYTIIRNPIVSQNGNTIFFAHNKNDIGWQKAPGYLVPKFFIQNDLRSLDANNEWYFDPNTKKINIYNTSMPTGVQVSAEDMLVNITSYGRDYITINGIDFTGANKAAVEIHNSKNISVNNCNFNYSGVNAIHADYGSNQDSIMVMNCTFENSNNCAINLSLNCTNAIINNNIIRNTGMVMGMMQNGGSSAIAINVLGAGSIITNNVIDSVGYSGIHISGNDTRVSANYVKNFCLQLLDGAGIYTYNGWPGTEEKGLNIYDNIVLYAGNKNEGIYLDDKTNNAQVYNNTIAYCSRGIYLHNTWNVNVHGNTCFGNSDAAMVSISDNKTVTAKNNAFYNNILIAKNSSDKLGSFEFLHENETASDSNYFVRLSHNNNAFKMKYNGAVSNNDLPQWQSTKSLDAHSHLLSVDNANNIKLEYNATSKPETIKIGDGNYVDPSGKAYNNSVTLQPYTSVVLIKK